MTTASIENGLVGAWNAQVTFVEGAREGETESVLLTFLADGVVVHADRIPVFNGQLPRGIGEWAGESDRFSYWFNVVLNEPSGRPTHVVYVHGQGTLAADGTKFTASGGGEVYGSSGELLFANRANVEASRAPFMNRARESCGH
ncbi:MAG: hypothetical protein JO181_12045 [Solirubrobacterales bacterium]|nr:hypothetical protein [Solirubrobacterales bacterium]